MAIDADLEFAGSLSLSASFFNHRKDERMKQSGQSSIKQNCIDTEYQSTGNCTIGTFRLQKLLELLP